MRIDRGPARRLGVPGSIDVPSFTGSEERDGRADARTFFEAWACRCSGSRSRTTARTCSARWAGAGGGPTLMFNGHMDTSYSGREPWLRDVPGFQPQAFERDGRLYGLGISNMKGALACYVEAVRALQDAGVRLRGDVLIAAVCGEIEKTQYGDATGAEYRGLRGRLALSRLARRRRRHVPARRADRGQGRARALRLALAAHPRARATSSTPRSARGSATQNSILRMHDVLDAVLEWIPTWEDDPANCVSRREGDRERRRDRGRLRLARLAHAASHRSLPRRARAADEGDGRSRAARCSTWVRSLGERFPEWGIEGEVYVTAPGAEIDEGHELVARDRRRARAGLRREARARRDALVQRRLRAHALRHPDRELRHVDRPDGRRARREPRDRRAREDGGDLRARRDGGLRSRDDARSCTTLPAGPAGAGGRRRRRPPRRARAARPDARVLAGRGERRATSPCSTSIRAPASRACRCSTAGTRRPARAAARRSRARFAICYRATLGVPVAGLSAQSLDDQVEFASGTGCRSRSSPIPSARLGAALRPADVRDRAASPFTSGSRSLPRMRGS